MVKLFLSVPCYGGQCLEAFAASVLQLSDICRIKKIELCIDTIENESLVQRARNIAVGRFMQKSDAEYFMFIDADIHFDPNSVIRLLESGHDFTCAAYPKKVVMWDKAATAVRDGDDRPLELLSSSLVMNFKGAKSRVENGFVPVLDGPTGFMLIKRCVFEQMEKKYPELNCKNDHQNRDFDDYCALFDCMIDPETKRYLSEDYAFCRRWQQMDGEIYCDTQTTLGHVGNLGFPACLKDRITSINKDVASCNSDKE